MKPVAFAIFSVLIILGTYWICAAYDAHYWEHKAIERKLDYLLNLNLESRLKKLETPPLPLITRKS